ncbi:hypothetical protein [Paroceanicella profunda]|uniref:hypothetical protein n=1 Tax=Paroceanicella profunda TaxID=2579971 RepID=UPI003D271F71
MNDTTTMPRWEEMRSEIDRLLGVEMELDFRLAILLMQTTAVRVSAVLEPTWSRVDLEREQVSLRRDGAGPRKGPIVPINMALRAALLSARQGGLSDRVIERGRRARAVHPQALLQRSRESRPEGCLAARPPAHRRGAHGRSRRADGRDLAIAQPLEHAHHIERLHAILASVLVGSGGGLGVRRLPQS